MQQTVSVKPGDVVKVLGSSARYPLEIPAGTVATVLDVWENNMEFPIELDGFFELVSASEIELLVSNGL